MNFLVGKIQKIIGIFYCLWGGVAFVALGGVFLEFLGMKAEWVEILALPWVYIRPFLMIEEPWYLGVLAIPVDGILMCVPIVFVLGGLFYWKGVSGKLLPILTALGLAVYGANVIERTSHAFAHEVLKSGLIVLCLVNVGMLWVMLSLWKRYERYDSMAEGYVKIRGVRLVLVLVLLGVGLWGIKAQKAGTLDPEYPKYSTRVIYHAGDFSGDGKKVYFLKEVQGWKGVKPRGFWDGWSIEECHLWLCTMNVDGSNPVQIREMFPGHEWVFAANSDNVCMAVCPKDDRIAWTSLGCMAEIDGLWVMDWDGGNMKKIMNQEKMSDFIQHPAWSPDGSFVAVQIGMPPPPPEDKRKIWKVSADGKKKVCLTEGPFDMLPAFSPDGRQIAFTRVADWSNLIMEIWVMDTDGKNRQKIAEGKVMLNAGWLRHEKRTLCYGSSQGTTAINLDTGDKKVIYKFGHHKINLSADYFLIVLSNDYGGVFIRPKYSVERSNAEINLKNKDIAGQRLRDQLKKKKEIW